MVGEAKEMLLDSEVDFILAVNCNEESPIYIIVRELELYGLSKELATEYIQRILSAWVQKKLVQLYSSGLQDFVECSQELSLSILEKIELWSEYTENVSQYFVGFTDIGVINWESGELAPLNQKDANNLINRLNTSNSFI